ncbi:hypothetical protein [Flavobacterium phage FCOV-F14]|uniref:Holin n=8 Tax=Ficleduovirus FCL2 TaxID=2560473 RepID=A0A0A0YNM0_9CAUD|nr:hypothetical protein ABG42_gp15 [Flavobacterium phage FCL-2]QCW21125.1 hypothetical protein [Flavobacterium phage FCOV-F13]QCW21199.1 hypothetical protein [Flavobacterium phage FCOV-F16]QCW21501.1 hypothetical protein [Flavobacterium phage FCOV-F45]QCW21575.1 hypothetical protein [Flavobacterium phage FCOV-F46]QCW21649.1 hypothetical protein [Flavobacterium phage FCOV-F54]QNJ51671.1 hypothetical protein [Flavobacterium phage FCOV-F14]QNJ51745.1 hypothetical protein [Flavobacterium phage F
MNLKDEFINIVIKVILPATIGISIKLAVQAQKQKITAFRIILSFITGIGASYIAYPIIINNSGRDYVPLFISVIAISSEKIAEYLIYKFNIDYFLGSLIEACRKMIIDLITKK